MATPSPWDDLFLNDMSTTMTIIPGIACTMDAKMCPDGTYVGRDFNNNCEWKECPHGLATIDIIVILCLVLAILACCSCIIYCVRKKRKETDTSNEINQYDDTAVQL